MLDVWKISVVATAATLAITGCSTGAQRKAAERAAFKKEVAAEVERICALPEHDRGAELKKVKEESGLELYCAK
jgi:hypothetical protein